MKGSDPAYDFLDSSGGLGKIELKGPFVDSNGAYVPSENQILGLLDSVLWEVQYSSAADTIVVDLFNIPIADQEIIIETVSRVAAGSTKIFFLK